MVPMRDDGGLDSGSNRWDDGKRTDFTGRITGPGDDSTLLFYSETHFSLVCSRGILGIIFPEYTYYE